MTNLLYQLAQMGLFLVIGFIVALAIIALTMIVTNGAFVRNINEKFFRARNRRRLTPEELEISKWDEAHAETCPMNLPVRMPISGGWIEAYVCKECFWRVWRDEGASLSSAFPDRDKRGAPVLKEMGPEALV